MSACSQILGNTFGLKTMAPTETKNFRFSPFFHFFRFSRKMEDEKQKIDFLHYWPNLGDFEGIFHGFPLLFAIFLMGILEIKNCLV